MTINHDTIDSIASYCIGGTACALSFFMHVADVFQGMAMIVGFFIVLLRFVHDVKKFFKK